MRAIYILFILFVVILNGCTTVQIAKEVTKAGDSVKTTIQKITKTQDESEKTDNISEEKNLLEEKEEIVVEKKKEKAVISKQKKITTINLQGKTLSQIIQDFGEPSLTRIDGNTKTVRFNTLSCRLFIYFDASVKKPKIEYYEIRNTQGDLIDKKEKINKCFKEIKKT